MDRTRKRIQKQSIWGYYNINEGTTVDKEKKNFLPEIYSRKDDKRKAKNLTLQKANLNQYRGRNEKEVG